MVVIKLKDILKESKVGYLVEAEPTAAEKKKKAEQKKIMATKIDFTIKKGKNKGKKDKITVRGALNQGEDHPAYTKAKRLAKKVDKKQKSADKKVDKKVEKDIEKIKNIKFTIQSPKGDKEVSVKDVLPNFGTDKKDKDTPATKKAQKAVHKYFEKKYEREGDKEFKKRMKDTVGKGKKKVPVLTDDEQQDFDKEVEKTKEYNENNKGETWFTEKQEPTKASFLREKITDKQEAKSDYYDPDSGDYWDRETEDDGDDDDWLSGFGDDDDDDGWGEKKKTDDYGNKLSKRGDKAQQQALELKLQVGVGSLKKQTKKGHHYVMGKDGKAVALAVFKDEKTGKHYGISDEGDIYENDKPDFRDMKEPTTNARGHAGAVTKKGQEAMDIRKGKGEAEDEYDKTTFSDLLGMLGIDTDIDWTDPFGSA